MAVTDFSESAIANGNIHPSVAVMFDSTKDFRVIEATSGAVACGIAQKGERRDPSNSDGYAAIAGENILYYGNGAKQVPAKLGASCSAGDLLKVTTGGALTPVTANNDFYIARARQAGASGDLIDVDVVMGYYGA